MLALACLWLCGLSRREVQELLDELFANAEYEHFAADVVCVCSAVMM